MQKSIRAIKKSSQTDGQDDDYNGNPEECIDILERLREEAEALGYESTVAFQRVVGVIRKK
ncbi:MAG: hypothetical protein JW768_03805 [Chitinispirillaceae bacterium]|nr:hypothetical protein [Chitinispirillaceae bacterium]